MTTSPAPLPMGLFVGTYLPYSETFIFDQLRHQRRFFAHVMAYSSRYETRSRFPYDPVLSLSRSERMIYLTTGRARRFERALEMARVRLIHAHFGPNGAYAARFARRLDVPLVVTFHGHDVSGLLPENRLTPRYLRYRALAPALFDQASLLLCASAELADRLIQDVGAPAHKIQVHRLGVDLDAFQPIEHSRGPARLILIGRFVEKKGFAYALHAFARLHQVQPEATLRIVGDGPLGLQLQRLAHDLGVTESVTFCGVLSAARVRDELRRANLLLAPSVEARNRDRESGVIVIKEANACGLPAVGTRHGGIPEIIDDGETGYLVPERDVDSLAERTIRLSTDADLRHAMGLAARLKIEREYDTRTQNERLESLLASTL